MDLSRGLGDVYKRQTYYNHAKQFAKSLSRSQTKLN
jgi:hypothetical protein